MTKIKAIASYVPDEGLDNIEEAKRFGETEGFIKNKIGALKLPRKSTNEETSDMAVKAVKKLSEQHGLDIYDIDLLVVVTQNPDGQGLPHVSAIVHGKLSLTHHVAAFDISLGCSGYIYALSIVKGLMEQVQYKNAVLVTADPYSKIINPNDRVTALLFGDASTATWLSEDGPWSIGVPLLQTDGGGCSNLVSLNRELVMNGRQVFNFASKLVPKQIKECLAVNKVAEKEIDVFCLHQSSKTIVEAIAKQFPESEGKFIKDIEGTGNTVSSSVPLLLEKYVMPSRYSKVLLSGFGVGLSWGTNIISTKGEEDV